MRARSRHNRKCRCWATFLDTVGAFERANFTPAIDYSRKRGLIAEINRTVLAIEAEARLLDNPPPAPTYPDGPVAGATGD